MERYIEKNGKKMRYGYTTGSCAAAASKAAAWTLFHQKEQEQVTIDTPKGWVLDIEVFLDEQLANAATYYVVKDSGDDPDVTNGIKIYAKAVKRREPGIVIEGGIGVGRVTKKGLRVPIGKAAINPVPLEMIRKEVSKVLPAGEGVSITIFVPEGIEIGRRTFNAKLGILGGISIIGTSGIVEPMSEEAFKESLKTEMSVLAAAGKKRLVFTFGNFGRDYVIPLGIKEKDIQKTSNFVAYMLDAAGGLGIKEILYVGHIGKMVKLAYGMPNTHSKHGDNRMAAILECGKDFIREEAEKATILQCNTTDEAYEELKKMCVEHQVLEAIGLACKAKAQEMSHHQVKVECVLFSTIHGTLAKTNKADKWLKEMAL